jgi:hypothetical protein
VLLAGKSMAFGKWPTILRGSRTVASNLVYSNENSCGHVGTIDDITTKMGFRCSKQRES